MSAYLSQYADCLLRAERTRECELALREAEQVSAETDEQSHIAELLRLRGLLWNMDGAKDQAIICLQQALKWSRDREARTFELRAARDLMRIAGKELQDEMATELQSVVAWFPPELDLPDLREAKELLRN